MTTYSPSDFDFILCHCNLAGLQEVVESVEAHHEVRVVREPNLCLTMIRAEDSLEKQEFYLGEALTTECEVAVNDIAGYGVCLGEEPMRTYCMAVLDALREQGRLDGDVLRFFKSEHERLTREQEEEFRRVLSTRVDFKLLEQE